MDVQKSEELVESLIGGIDKVVNSALDVYNEMPLLGIALSGKYMDQVFCNRYLEQHITFDDRGNPYFDGHLIVWRPEQESRVVIFSR